MVEKHRRVESRQIIGTGMATDAQRIEDLETERARAERAWREQPKKGFGEVLDETPAMEADDEPDEDPRRRKRREEEERARDAEVEKARLAASTTVDAAKPAPPAGSLPRRPPDPREAMLRKALGAKPGPATGAKPAAPSASKRAAPTASPPAPQRTSSSPATPRTSSPATAPAPMTFDVEPIAPPKKGR